MTKLVVTLHHSMTAGDLIVMMCRGVSAFRINCAHLDEFNWVHDDERQVNEVIEPLRRAVDATGIMPKVFADLPGPKARIWFSPRQRLVVNSGDRLRIREVRRPIDDGTLQIVGPELFRRIEAGSHLLIRHRGPTRLRVESCRASELEVVALSEGLIGWGYHVICEGPYVSTPGLSVQDSWILPAILQANPEFICVSFADSPAVVQEIRKRIKVAGITSGVLAKVESPVGLVNLMEILDVADGVIIGRDDLSNWLDVASVRVWTPRIIQACKSRSRISVPASNYFSGLCEGDKLTSENKDDLAKTLAMEPDFLYCNETLRANCWEKVITSATNLGMLVPQ